MKPRQGGEVVQRKKGRGEGRIEKGRGRKKRWEVTREDGRERRKRGEGGR